MLFTSITNASDQYDFTIINAGIPENNSRQGLARFENDVIDKKPVLAVIYFGMNDAINDLNAVSELEFRENLKKMIALCKNNNIKPVLITINPVIENILYQRHEETLKSFYLSRGGANKIIDGYNSIIRETGKTEKVDVLDFHQAVMDQGGAQLAPESPVSEDGVHLSPEGSLLLASLVADYIKENLKNNSNTIICIGDSITHQGYPELILKIINKTSHK